MSLTGAKIKEAFRKLLYTNDLTSPASVKITAANNDEVAVTSLAVDITGNAATATNGITTASAVTALSGNSGGRSTTITAAEGTKLAAIEASATADQTNDEIKAAVEAASDSNTFTDVDHSKLNAIDVTAIVLNTAKVTNATHTGDVTGSGTLTIADDAVTTVKIDDDAVTADKLADSINTEIAANTAKDTNVSTNLTITGDTAARTIVSSDGTDAVIPAATDSVSGVMSAADHTIFTANTTHAASTHIAVGGGSGDAMAGDTDITSVDKDALETALALIDTSVTIGSSTSIDTTISGDLNVAAGGNFNVLGGSIGVLGGMTTTGDVNGASPAEMARLSGASDNLQTQITANTTEIGVHDDTFVQVDLDLLARVEVAGDTMTGDLNMGANVVGFTQQETDGTGNVVINFHSTGLKQYINTSAAMTDIELHFPAYSCNCILTIEYGHASYTVGTWDAYEGTGTGTDVTFKWAAGVEPTWTETYEKFDLISVYYDAENKIAFAAASLNF